jgi:hypothetical protein
MEPEYEEQDFEDEEELFSPEMLFSLSLIINGNKTAVNFNCCGKGSPNEYYAVNLLRNGSCVNSFTLAKNLDANRAVNWKFEESSVPRELKMREQEFSTAINKFKAKS